MPLTLKHEHYNTIFFKHNFFNESHSFLSTKSLDNPCILDVQISMNCVKLAKTQIILYMVKQKKSHNYEIFFDQINMVAYALRDVSRK